jgi:hypothetical protein
MDYVISEFGQFERYTPNPLPELAPPGAMFARRVSDGLDWYALAHKRGSFPDGAVLATVLPGSDPDVFLVQAVVWAKDAATIFPGLSLLLQIDGVPADVEKPHRLFENQLYRRSTGTISPAPAPVKHILSKKTLWDRMTPAEADAFDADLLEAPSKLRRAFDAAAYLDDRDDLWPALRNALLVRVTAARADALLERTE